MAVGKRASAVCQRQMRRRLVLVHAYVAEIGTEGGLEPRANVFRERLSRACQRNDRFTCPGRQRRCAGDG